MKREITDIAWDYMQSNECNFYAADIPVELKMHGMSVDVETIWFDKAERKIMLHCCCEQFEADIDIESLSDRNQSRLAKILEPHIKKGQQPTAMPKRTTAMAAVVLGATATHRYEVGDYEGLRSEVDDGNGSVIIKEFNTEAERRAYMQGIEDGNGWEDYHVVSGANVKRLSEIIKL